MKTRTVKHLVASTLVLGLLATVQAASAAPQGIANTRHNLGSNGQAIGPTGTRTGGTGMGDVFVLSTDEICVFCHTPHGANTSVPVPLWNKASLASTTYTTFSSGTMNSTAPANLAGHMSLACLSCHDGTQAMDNVVNAPGQGGFNKNNYMSGIRIGDSRQLDGSYSGAPGWYAGANTITMAAYDAGDTTGGKLISGAGVDFIGTDLSNDHPIGMAYGGGGCAGVGAVGSPGGCNDTDFKAAQTGLGSMFQVGSATAGAKDAMRIYGSTLASATVECASCHDPHTDAQATFLRKSNAASGVCLTCHTK